MESNEKAYVDWLLEKAESVDRGYFYKRIRDKMIEAQP